MKNSTNANPFFLALGIVAFLFAGFNLALSLYGADFVTMAAGR